VSEDEKNIIWHYTTFEALVEILNSRSLLASDYRALNDSREFGEGTRLLRQGLEPLRDHAGEDLRILTGVDPGIIDTVSGALDHVEEVINGQVICFSGAYDNLSMWRGYGSLAHGG
jgi:hypothetical protein